MPCSCVFRSTGSVFLCASGLSVVNLQGIFWLQVSKLLMWKISSQISDADHVNIESNDSDSGDDFFATDNTDASTNCSVRTDKRRIPRREMSHLSPWIDDEVVSIFVHAVCLVDDVSVALTMPFVDVLLKAAAYVSSFRGRQESDETNPNPVLKFADDCARGNGAFLYPRTNGMEAFDCAFARLGTMHPLVDRVLSLLPPQNNHPTPDDCKEVGRSAPTETQHPVNSGAKIALSDHPTSLSDPPLKNSKNSSSSLPPFPFFGPPSFVVAQDSAPLTAEVPKIAHQTILGVCCPSNLYAQKQESGISPTRKLAATAASFVCAADPRILSTAARTTSCSQQPNLESDPLDTKPASTLLDAAPSAGSCRAMLQRGNLMYHSLILSDRPFLQGFDVGRAPGHETSALPCHICLPNTMIPRVRIDPVSLMPGARGRAPRSDSPRGKVRSGHWPQQSKELVLGQASIDSDTYREELVSGVFASCSVPDWTKRCVGSLRRAEGALVGDLGMYLQSISFRKPVTIASLRAASELVAQAESLRCPVLPHAIPHVPTNGVASHKTEFVVESMVQSRLSGQRTCFQVSRWADHNRWNFPFHSSGVLDVDVGDSQFQGERRQMLLRLRDRRARNFRARLFHHSADSEDDDSDSDGVERLQDFDVRMPPTSWKKCSAALASEQPPRKLCCVAVTALGVDHTVCPSGQHVVSVTTRVETDNPCQEAQEARVALGAEKVRFEWLSRTWVPIESNFIAPGSSIDPFDTRVFISTWCHSTSALANYRSMVARIESVANCIREKERPSSEEHVPVKIQVEVPAGEQHVPPGHPQRSYYSPENAFSYSSLNPLWEDVSATMECIRLTRRRRVAAREVALEQSRQLKAEANRVHQLFLERQARERASEAAEADRMFAAELESQEYERQEMLMWTPGHLKVMNKKGEKTN
eukprot:INCI5897.1.p1 GENE.INCI5897.1~~INCI5897.1.p1  ORF type:complete len:929 (+),score=135.45 INCI5897.1:1152-3938(+)